MECVCFGFVIFVAILSPGASGVAAANCAWSGPSTLSFRYCKRFCTSTRIGDGAITTLGNAVGKPQQQNRRETSSMKKFEPKLIWVQLCVTFAWNPYDVEKQHFSIGIAISVKSHKFGKSTKTEGTEY